MKNEKTRQQPEERESDAPMKVIIGGVVRDSPKSRIPQEHYERATNEDPGCQTHRGENGGDRQQARLPENYAHRSEDEHQL